LVGSAPKMLLYTRTAIFPSSLHHFPGLNNRLWLAVHPRCCCVRDPPYFHHLFITFQVLTTAFLKISRVQNNIDSIAAYHKNYSRLDSKMKCCIPNYVIHPCIHVRVPRPVPRPKCGDLCQEHCSLVRIVH